MAIKDDNAIARGFYNNLRTNPTLATVMVGTGSTPHNRVFYQAAEQEQAYPYIIFQPIAGAVRRRHGFDDLNMDIWQFSVRATAAFKVNQIETALIESIAAGITIGTLDNVGIVRDTTIGTDIELRDQNGFVIQKIIRYQVWTT